MKNKSENIKVFVRIKPTMTELLNQSKRKLKNNQTLTSSKRLELIEEKISGEMYQDEKNSKQKALENQDPKIEYGFGSPISNISKTSLIDNSYQKELDITRGLRNSILNTQMKINNNLKEDIVIEKIQDNSLIYLKNDKVYEFEGVFDQSQKNQDLFDQIIMPNFDFILKGNNFTVFMYGQTNSGKTFTMKGNNIKKKNNKININQNSVKIVDIKKSALRSKQKLENLPIQNSSLKEEGIIQKTLKQLFKFLENKKNCNYRIKVFYYEIYNEKIFDLLSEKKQSLKVQENKEGKVIIQNIQEPYIKNYYEALKIFHEGENRRKFASTKWNHNSSRSHVIFSIQIEIKYKSQFLKSYFPTITMADLAGSESLGDQKKFSEGANINKSLLALTTVIKKLNKKKDYVAFRESKLTRILKPFLQGDSRTCIICTINPLKKYEHESLNTLRFGISAGGITINFKDSNLDISQTKENNEELKQNYIKEINIFEQQNQQLQEQYEKVDLQLQFSQEQLINLKQDLDSKIQIIDFMEKQNNSIQNSYKQLQEQVKILVDQNNILQKQLESQKQKQQICKKNQIYKKKDSLQNQNQDNEYQTELSKLKQQNKQLLKKIHDFNFRINFGKKKSIRNIKQAPSQKKIQIDMSKEYKNIKKLKKKIKLQEQKEQKFLKNQQNLKLLIQKKNEQIKKMSNIITSQISSSKILNQFFLIQLHKFTQFLYILTLTSRLYFIIHRFKRCYLI